VNQNGNGDLPFDLGTDAYLARKHWRLNPYAEGTWQHSEWYDGWSHGEQCDSSDSYDWSTEDFKPVAAPAK